MPIPMTKEGRKLMWERCAQIEKNGGNVLSYLKSEGYVSPRGTWFNLQDEFSGRKRSQFTDGKPGGKKIMGRKITLEDKKNAVKVALGGGDPEEHLRSQGIKDTRQAWYRIRADLKTADPETWEKLEAMKKEGRRKKEPEEMKKRFEVQQEPVQQKNPEVEGHDSVRAEDVEEFTTPIGEVIKRITDEIMNGPDKDRILKDLEKKLIQSQEPVAVPKEPAEGLSLKITKLKGERHLYEFDGGNLLVKKIGFADRLNLGTIEETEQFVKELKEAIKRFTA